MAADKSPEQESFAVDELTKASELAQCRKELVSARRVILEIKRVCKSQYVPRAIHNILNQYRA